MPTDFDALLRLPGVARKTANVVSAERGDAQGIVVDTHVRRLSQRLGFTRQEDPVKIERDLIRLVPREDWARFPHLLIWHGRRVCDARRPALRALRRHRPVPVEPGRASCGYAGVRRDEQPAVVVVGGEEVARRPSSRCPARVRSEQRLLELPHAPLADGLDRRRVGEPERLGDVAAQQVAPRSNPVSSKTPSPVARTRRSWSQTMNPVACAG